MLITSRGSIPENQEAPANKDFRSAILNAVRTYNMTIMGTYSDVFKTNETNEEIDEGISLFANAFVVEYKDDGICYAIMHNEATLWISTDESMPNTTEEVTDMLFDYYDSIVSEANKVRKKLK